MALVKRYSFGQIVIFLVGLVISLLCLIPFLMVVSGSLSNEKDIMVYGYTLIPKKISFLAYRVLLSAPGTIVNSYAVTIFVTAAGTLLSVFITSMIGYVISRRTLKYAKAISFYCLITVLFSGGMVPWYIVCINYLHLKNQLMALIVPYLVNGWNIFLMRNFLLTIPEEIYESARMDGASELRTMVRIILPLAKPALATISLFVGLNYWNDWWLSLMLIDKENLRPIQYLLRVIVSNVQFIRSNMGFSSELQKISELLPNEGVKMATCIITIGPILFLYPFLQKYFIKGIMIGAVKG